MTPAGRTSEKWYGVGYQSALDDLAKQLDQGGVSAVFEWIYNNASDAATRQTVAHLKGST